MDSAKKKISMFELHTSILVYMVCTSVYNNYIHFASKHNVWISAIISIFIGLFYIYIYMSLSSTYHDKTVIQINDIIFGNYIGKLISCIYIFIFSAQLLDTMVWSSFLLEESVAPDLSRFFGIVLITVISLIAIKNGINPVIRYALVLVVMGYVVLILSYILLFEHMDFSNLFPIEVPLKDMLKGSILYVDYTYGESIYLFFIIFPAISNIKSVLYEKKKYIYFTVIFGGIFTIFAYVRNAAIIGNLSILYRHYYLNVVRNIEIGETRLELFFILENISFLFFFFCIILYALIRSTSQLLNTRNYRLLSISIAVLFLGATYFIISNISVVFYGKYYDKIYNYLIPVLKLGTPIITLLLFYVRKKLIKNLPDS